MKPNTDKPIQAKPSQFISSGTSPYTSSTQDKNLAWVLPRPHPSHYKGGFPLHAEKWLLHLACDILHKLTISVLSLFSGMSEYGFRVDISPSVSPDLVCDAHELSSFLHQSFHVILADPPYSTEEAKELYGTPPLKYKKWTAEATKVLEPNGLLIVYHKYMMPNPNPDVYRVAKRVFIGTRTWHLARVATYFQKKV